MYLVHVILIQEMIWAFLWETVTVCIVWSADFRQRNKKARLHWKRQSTQSEPAASASCRKGQAAKPTCLHNLLLTKTVRIFCLSAVPPCRRCFRLQPSSFWLSVTFRFMMLCTNLKSLFYNFKYFHTFVSVILLKFTKLKTSYKL